jgi:RNA polymerase sigma-70 factor (ECF subfamily)
MIIDLYFERDERALSECDKKYGISLRTFASRLLGDEGGGEECLDDTYMKSWELIPPSEPRDYLFAFLSKILRRKCIDRIRFRAREKRGAAITAVSDELVGAEPSAESADSGVLGSELSEIIAEFVRSLPNQKREVFVLRYFYMEEVIAIAKRLGVTEGKIKTDLKRMRDKLRLHLLEYGYTV